MVKIICLGILPGFLTTSDRHGGSPKGKGQGSLNLSEHLTKRQLAPSKWVDGASSATVTWERAHAGRPRRRAASEPPSHRARSVRFVAAAHRGAANALGPPAAPGTYLGVPYVFFFFQGPSQPKTPKLMTWVSLWLPARSSTKMGNPKKKTGHPPTCTFSTWVSGLGVKESPDFGNNCQRLPPHHPPTPPPTPPHPTPPRAFLRSHVSRGGDAEQCVSDAQHGDWSNGGVWIDGQLVLGSDGSTFAKTHFSFGSACSGDGALGTFGGNRGAWNRNLSPPFLQKARLSPTNL